MIGMLRFFFFFAIEYHEIESKISNRSKPTTSVAITHFIETSVVLNKHHEFIIYASIFCYAMREDL